MNLKQGVAIATKKEIVQEFTDNQHHVFAPDPEDKNNAVTIMDVNFSYHDNSNLIIKNISLKVPKGKYVTFIGHNGSGKSTLTKLISGIIKPNDGIIYIRSIPISQKTIAKIRKNIGVVFQNPDNQFIGSTVYDDIMFGLENINTPREEINDLVLKYAEKVGLTEFLDSEPSSLSGGQKQRAAIASVFSLNPKIVIFDEATSMLDPYGKKEIKGFISDLARKSNKTVISVTHDMEETINSDYVYAFKDGELLLEGEPADLFKNHYKTLEESNIELPNSYKIPFLVKKYIPGFTFRNDFWTTKNTSNIDFSDNTKELSESLRPILLKKITKEVEQKLLKKFLEPEVKLDDVVIDVRNVNFTYSKKTPFERQALKDVSFKIYRNKINTIIGSTGCGKSTIIQQLNGLMLPDSGEIELLLEKNKFLINNKNIFRKNSQDKYKKLRKIEDLRQNIGLIFQFPEYQLFKDTVLKEIIFAPLNFGKPKDQCIKEATQHLKDVKLPTRFLSSNPFDLSGGQKRRLAIASILSYNPSVLVFDEPIAGLDPKGEIDIMNLVEKQKIKNKKSIVLITHNMDHALEFSDVIHIFYEGCLKISGTPWDILSNEKLIKENNLVEPYVIKVIKDLDISVLNQIKPKSIKILLDIIKYILENNE